MGHLLYEADWTSERDDNVDVTSRSQVWRKLAMISHVLWVRSACPDRSRSRFQAGVLLLFEAIHADPFGYAATPPS
ncbi:hypothetical protein ACQEVF_21285 [Nonomuraea polychroma]|uniref:hypothetical protein n=1 Tax=Nonomuraea polychroma TaxID=46176 RepID=UPI003D91E011